MPTHRRDDPEPSARLELRFTDQAALAHLEDPIERDLSAAARCDGHLFLSCDEAAGVERLTEDGGHWARHRHFSFADLLDLPGGPEGEMDIEGLDCADGWLWVV